jgi:hypothetical protein
MLPFWLDDQQHVSMSFEKVDGKVLVCGSDPDASDRSTSEFKAVLRTEQQEAFINAVKEGRQAQPMAWVLSNTNATTANVATNTVVIVGPGTGDGSGPKAPYQLILAQPLAAAVAARAQ